MKQNNQDKFIKTTIARYNERLLKYGYNPKTLGWLKGRQGIRYSVLTSIGNINNSSILDVGCGFGDLYGFLLYKKLSCKYVGIDVNPKLIQVGISRYPKAKFIEGNIENGIIRKKFDWIIISGMFNYKHAKKYEYIETILKKIFSSCKKGIAVDFMTDYVDFRNSNANYVSPEKIFKICKKISERVVLRHDYMPYEFSVFMYKDNMKTKNLVYGEFRNSLDKNLRDNKWLKNVGNEI